MTGKSKGIRDSFNKILIVLCFVECLNQEPLNLKIGRSLTVKNNIVKPGSQYDVGAVSITIEGITSS